MMVKAEAIGKGMMKRGEKASCLVQVWLTRFVSHRQTKTLR